MIGGNFWAPASTSNTTNTPVMTEATTSPSVVGQILSPNIQGPARQASQVSLRSPKRSHSESNEDDDTSVEIKKQKYDEVADTDSSTVALPLRMKPQLSLQSPVTEEKATTVGDAIPQPTACKRKRQDTASHDELAILLKKLKCDGDESVAAKSTKSKSSWDSFDVKEFDNKSGKLYGSWDFKQLSYKDVQSGRLLNTCTCSDCEFLRNFARYST